MLRTIKQEQLRSAGYECSGSHTETRALKTRGPVDAVMAAVARATAEKVQVRLSVTHDLTPCRTSLWAVLIATLLAELGCICILCEKLTYVTSKCRASWSDR